MVSIMTLEREVLISLLTLSRNGKATLDDICENTRTILDPVRRVVQEHVESGYLQLEEESVIVKNRVQLAVRAVELGADLERVCDLLSWDEFEDISVEAFEASSFRVLKHFRFKSSSRRWEVDLLGMKKPLILSVDCKHWHKGWHRSSIRKIAESQVERTQALMEASDLLRGKMGISEWKKAVFVPVILSLIPGPFKFYEKTPIVPVLHIRDFLNEVFPYLNSLKSFSREYGPSIDEY